MPCSGSIQIRRRITMAKPVILSEAPRRDPPAGGKNLVDLDHSQSGEFLRQRGKRALPQDDRAFTWVRIGGYQNAKLICIRLYPPCPISLGRRG